MQGMEYSNTGCAWRVHCKPARNDVLLAAFDHCGALCVWEVVWYGAASISYCELSALWHVDVQLNSGQCTEQLSQPALSQHPSSPRG